MGSHSPDGVADHPTVGSRRFGQPVRPNMLRRQRIRPRSRLRESYRLLQDGLDSVDAQSERRHAFEIKLQEPKMRLFHYTSAAHLRGIYMRWLEVGVVVPAVRVGAAGKDPGSRFDHNRMPRGRLGKLLP